jgi:DNA-directed RNA polymerase subunit RPC12/RpoP
MLNENHAKEYMGYCSFCGRPLLFTEEKAQITERCPACSSPIAFVEKGEGESGYNVVPNLDGDSFVQGGCTVERGILTGYDKSLSEIVIPEGTLAVGEGLFKDNRALKKVTLPESLLHILHEAFYGCEGLRSLTLPSSLLTIGNSAFRGCRRLERVRIPDSLVAAGYEMFHSCDNLTELLLPMDMKYIGGSPYGFCKRLKVANIPHCVREPGPAWFQYNDAIEILTVGRNVGTLPCPSPTLRELHLCHKDGWREKNTALGGKEEPIPRSAVDKPKAAASLLKKLAASGLQICRPEIVDLPYWYVL